jgi:ferredoxin-NADP reductase
LPDWVTAKVVDIRVETPRAKTYRLALPGPSEHLAGQHYVLRLTAEDGYSAQRSYSVASAPDGSNEIELTIEKLEDGEVSTFVHDEVIVGDELEVRGPIGLYFVWKADTPALLVGGGSGIVPLMAMLRLARQQDRADLLKMIVSVRTPTDLFYASELKDDAMVVYTRESPANFARPVGRLMPDDLRPLWRGDATAFVCGSTRFAEAASRRLVELGVPEAQIKIERFGPSG